MSPNGSTQSFCVDKNVAIPMRDGTVLRADVWRPQGGEPGPAILHRTPYQKEIVGSTDTLRVDLAAAQGYVVVVQDTRGRFASDGHWDGLSAAMWAQEGLDSFDTVEWIATQPWCDGAVGMWGTSYAAAVTWLGAAHRPPHLRAIAPAMMGDRRGDETETGGAFRLHTYVTFYLGIAAVDLPATMASGLATADDAARLLEALRDPDPVLEYMPLRDCPALTIPGSPVTPDELITGDAGRPPHAFAVEEVRVPALLVGGWYDLWVGQTITQYQRLRTATPQLAHRLVIGPWTHQQWLSPVQGEVSFGWDAAGLMRVHPRHLSFFDRHLKNAEEDFPPVSYFLMGANEWRDADHWPPSATVEQSWYLHSTGEAQGPDRAGTLSPDRPGDEPADHFTYDPMEPVRTHGGRLMGPGIPGPVDQAKLSARGDVLTYTSEPLSEPLDIVGPVSVRLVVSTSARNTDFAARLIDVHPDGRCILITSGLRRLPTQVGSDITSFSKGGQAQEVCIDLTHTAIRIQAGHRLQLLVCSSDFPHFDRNMNTGHAVGTDTEAVIAEQTVFHDAARPSHVRMWTLSP